MPSPLRQFEEAGAHVELTLDGDQLAEVWDWLHGRGPNTDAVTLFKDHLRGLTTGKHSAVTIGLGSYPDDLTSPDSVALGG
jgi:hypothetical protein